MLKKYLVYLIVTTLLLIGCQTEQQKSSIEKPSLSKEENREKIIKIGWEFYYYEDENNTQLPYSTDVFFVLRDVSEKKIKIGKYQGKVSEIKDIQNRDFPPDTIIACHSYTPGGGDDLRVIREEDTLYIQWREFVETSEDIEKPEFINLKDIKLKPNSYITILKKDE
ncbi:hypothetical protein R9X47_15640 [Wukongibacter baidiensis]|uniref:hypothetical protein n=1 Tax=Wukongibacter baidiensis TaxID=1723361 RepID=UPI003D7F4515